MQLSSEQVASINHLSGPALILAVPGAGKTTVLLHRTRILVEKHKVDPTRILSITFSKSSANDMKKRYNNDFSKGDLSPHFMTIHAFCYTIVRDFYRITNKKLTLIEDESIQHNKYLIIKSLFSRINNQPITEDKLEAFFSYYGYIKNKMLSPRDYSMDNRIEVENFQLLFSEYEKYKNDHQLLDFDDMLTIAYDILKENPKILNICRSKFDYYQLDEGQDTSKLQFEILKLLAYPNNNLFVVADDDQSIYGFRGANPQELLDFNKVFSNAKIYYMVDNYRSSKNIVTASNGFIQSNTKRYRKTIKTSNPPADPVEVIKLKDQSSQYDFIMKDILRNKGKSVAVLYRNNLSSIGLIDYFDRQSISFVTNDTKLKIFNHWVLKDIVAFISFSDSSFDYDSFFQIYYKTKGYISKDMLLWAASNHINLNVFQRLLRYPGISEFYKKQIRELELDYRRIKKLTIDMKIKYILDTMGYDKYLKDNSIKYGYSYKYLRSILDSYIIIGKSIKDLDSFKSRLKHISTLIKNSSTIKSKITFSTIHSAKGLEFDHVYIIDLIEGEFPSITESVKNNGNNLDELEEERRVFYVGMTRAKLNLKLLWYATNGNSKANPSLFIKELSNNITLTN